jgi:hypothetical protein
MQERILEMSMNKRLRLLAALLLVAILLLPAQALAHVAIKDRASGTGAILHLNPDDDPIAGEQATLFFDIRDDSITPESSRATLTITNEQRIATPVPVTMRGSSVAARHIFPRQGIYHIRLHITQENRSKHTFLYSQRVGRGISGGAVPQGPPAWAEIGGILTLVTVALTAIIAYNRRKAIQQYSKW